MLADCSLESGIRLSLDAVLNEEAPLLQVLWLLCPVTKYLPGIQNNCMARTMGKRRSCCWSPLFYIKQAYSLFRTLILCIQNKATYRLNVLNEYVYHVPYLWENRDYYGNRACVWAIVDTEQEGKSYQKPTYANLNGEESRQEKNGSYLNISSSPVLTLPLSHMLTALLLLVPSKMVFPQKCSALFVYQSVVLLHQSLLVLLLLVLKAAH